MIEDLSDLRRTIREGQLKKDGFLILSRINTLVTWMNDTPSGHTDVKEIISLAMEYRQNLPSLELQILIEIAMSAGVAVESGLNENDLSELSFMGRLRYHVQEKIEECKTQVRHS